MRLFDRSFSLLLVTCGLPLLFLPKINLFAFAGETAGIRIDDIVLVFLSILIVWAHFSLEKRANKIEWWGAAVIAFSFISFGLNRFFVAKGWLEVNASLFYCLRLAEYFIFFYIGALSVQFFKASTVIRTFFLWNLLLMLLQKMEIVGQFTVDGYMPSVAARLVGIASFPSEAGMLLNMIFCFFIYNEEPSKRLAKLVSANVREFFSQTYIYWMFLLFSALIIATGARIAIFALTIVFLFRVKDELKKRSFASWTFACVFLIIGIAFTFVMIENTTSVSKRSIGLLSMKNIELIGVVWDQINLSYDPIGNESVKYEAYDMSWWMRIHKWCYALKIYYLNPECWLQGVGPGFAMAALDGGFLRILTEYGLIGLFLFWNFFRQISQQSRQLYWMMVAFGINMIFFDVYLAYKPMSLLFFVSGSVYASERQLSSAFQSSAALARVYQARIRQNQQT